MKARYGLFGMVALMAMPVFADTDVAGKDVERFAQDLAREMSGARGTVARDADGTVRWAGVWMEKTQACPNGRLGDGGKRLVAEGGRFAGDHGARLILFTPRADAPAVERDARDAAEKVHVLSNDLIGEHCYLVIQR